ncbi:hypothetical protein MIR68_005600 [Amoeboaphelidium protococcarum]|nr:hypothetical protein MIR68_005600 [Amoeboaphelidium protococcarum]
MEAFKSALSIFIGCLLYPLIACYNVVEDAVSCTILLRGTQKSALTKVKAVAKFFVYCMYSVKQESYLLRDCFSKRNQEADAQQQSLTSNPFAQSAPQNLSNQQLGIPQSVNISSSESKSQQVVDPAVWTRPFEFGKIPECEPPTNVR